MKVSDVLDVHSSDSGRQRRNQQLELRSTLAWAKRLPRWAKISLAGVCLVLVAFALFMIVREIQGCGCPAQFASRDASTNSESCECTGDVFNCKYTCPGNVHYCGQTPCGKADDGGGTAGSGSVVCAGKPAADFCDCSPGDCADTSAGSNCGCAAATVAACCGRLNATRLRA